jgi:putative addiction module killer protein
MMNELRQSERFKKWLCTLDDDTAHKIELRIMKAEDGNFGDCVSVGEGVFEMRLHFGPGYRLYYFQRGPQLYLLLTGGDKKTQAADIETAKEMKRRIERGEPC